MREKRQFFLSEERQLINAERKGEIENHHGAVMIITPVTAKVRGASSRRTRVSKGLLQYTYQGQCIKFYEFNFK